MQSAEVLEVQVGSVHDVEDTGLWQQHVQDIDIMQFANTDVDES